MLKKTKGESYLYTTHEEKKDTIIPAAIFVVLYAVWAVLVASGSRFIHQFDHTLIGVICNNNPAAVKFATTFTNLGNTSVIVLETIILVVILVIFRKYAYALFTAGTMIAANGYNWILKHAIERHRPPVHHL
ncbi:PAP2 family protein, partial [Lactobacillus sp. XV13L]|nr:PAP2 family protein [Lactobacillus sp. XV13L]